MVVVVVDSRKDSAIKCQARHHKEKGEMYAISLDAIVMDLFSVPFI